MAEVTLRVRRRTDIATYLMLWLVMGLVVGLLAIFLWLWLRDDLVVWAFA